MRAEIYDFESVKASKWVTFQQVLRVFASCVTSRIPHPSSNLPKALGKFESTFPPGEGMRLRRDKKGAFCNAPFLLFPNHIGNTAQTLRRTIVDVVAGFRAETVNIGFIQRNIHRDHHLILDHGVAGRS